MSGFKIGRATEDIKRELTDILRKVKDPRVSGLLSIVKLDLSGDMSSCKVYVSSLEGMESTRQSVKGLESAQGYIRRELGSRLRLRKTPELRFLADDSIEVSAKISKLLGEILPEEPSPEQNASEEQEEGE